MRSFRIGTLICWMLLVPCAGGTAQTRDHSVPYNVKLVPEIVRFEALGPPPGELATRLAVEKGKQPATRKSTTLIGRLSRPVAMGALPAIVLLHGSGGVSPWNDLWIDRLTGWDYVVLDVDSRASRGLHRHSRRQVAPILRAYDALGALMYLRRQDFVDADRIAVMGASHGGTTATLAIAPMRGVASKDQFRAAVAVSPLCRRLESLVAPLLVVIGRADDMTPAELCETRLLETPSRYELSLKVYPDAHHGFDSPGADSKPWGFTLRYNEQAAKRATAEIKAFLAKYLR